MDCRELENRLLELESKQSQRNEVMYGWIALAVIVSVVSFLAGGWSANDQDQRLQRLERISGIDEIGRRT